MHEQVDKFAASNGRELEDNYLYAYRSTSGTRPSSLRVMRKKYDYYVLFPRATRSLHFICFGLFLASSTHPLSQLF
ncbi:hypothetical protein PMIN04_000406 [Paraphaeosphaeria minitans]